MRQGSHHVLPQIIEKIQQIVTLVRDNPDIASKLIPQSSEWRELSDSDYDAYILWLSHCVGISFPTFNVTIENLSDQEQLITKVLYRTVETGQVMGGLAGALSPEATYVHEIAWMSGDQEASLVPPFSIPPKSSASFALQLTTKSGDCGLGWLVEIYFIIDEERGAVSTDQFQLIMSGPTCGK